MNKSFKEKSLFILKQVLITGVNALVGLMIVQSLEKKEYAAYTITFSFLAVFVNITNIGITPAMTGIGGRIWSDRYKLKALLNSAFVLRRRIGWWLALPFGFYCFWQFSQAEASTYSAFALVVLILFAAWIQIQTALYAIVLQLNKAVPGLQRNELRSTLLKFLGLIPLIYFNAPVPFIVGWICFCLATILWTNKRLAGGFLDGHNQTNPRFLSEIYGIIRPNILRTIYWSFEGQISILLCAIFANTENIAEIGALGRLAILFSILQAFIINYSLPGIAKEAKTKLIASKTWKVLAITAALIIPILCWAMLHPASLLWILGSNYKNLTSSLVPFLLAVSIGQLAAVVYQICAAKAWIHLNRYYVPLALPLQVSLIYWLDLSDINNVILFLGINNLFFLSFNVLMFNRALHKSKLQPSSN